MRWAICLAAIWGLLHGQLRAQLSSGLPSTRPTSQAIEALIAELSDDAWQARQRAQDQLVAIGEDVLPHLQKTLAQTTDEEVRTRVESAIRQIGVQIARGPTRLTLHVKNANLRDVLDELQRQTKTQFALRDSLGGERKITLDVDRQPFWLVMNEIFKQTGVGTQAMNTGEMLVLAPGNVNGQLPWIMADRFLVTADTRYRSGTDSIMVNLSLWADPKVRVLAGSYYLELQEAVDENGKSIAGAQPTSGVTRTGSRWQHRMICRLTVKEGESRRIARLRGLARLRIMSKWERWQVGDVLKIANVSRDFPDARCTINRVQANGQNYQVLITIQGKAVQPGLANLQPFNPRESIELQDASGQAFLASSLSGRGGNGSMEYTLQFRARPGADFGEPAKLIWTVPVETEDIQVPIDFRNLALP